MIKKIFVVIALAALASPVLAEDPAPPAIDKKVGHGLLDSFTNFFHEMAVSGSGGFEKIRAAAEKFTTEARQAKEKNQIDAVFYNRYRRILSVMYLTMIPLSAGIIEDVQNQEFAHFIKDVLGEEYRSVKEHSIGQLAYAISEEILNLHLYLDDSEAKDKLRKSFEGKFLDATPKKEAVKK